MDQNSWTLEHVQKYGDNIDEAELISSLLEDAHKEHLKGGRFFKTTKHLLNSYRLLRFDIINEKMMKLSESMDDGRSKNSIPSLDDIIAMPEIYNYYSKEISNFVSSNTPVSLGTLVHVVDMGITLLEKSEEQTTPKFSEILKASYIGKEMSPDELCDYFKMNRATFYRKKDDAITALSIIIFGSLGDRHPSSVFNDRTLRKKFGNFMEVADTMDLLRELDVIAGKRDKE